MKCSYCRRPSYKLECEGCGAPAPQMSTNSTFQFAAKALSDATMDSIFGHGYSAFHNAYDPLTAQSPLANQRALHDYRGLANQNSTFFQRCP